MGGEVSDVSPLLASFFLRGGRFSFCHCFGGRANAFFFFFFLFGGRPVGGKKCHHPAFDWVLEGEH